MANKWKTFSPEEMKILSENLWVKKVTPKMLIFTDAFKEEFSRLYRQGNTSRAVIEELGFDPEMLGRTRVEGIQLIVKDYIAKKQFSDESPDIPVVSGSSVTSQLKRMQHKLSYMEQQIEFIKKTILAEREARRL